MLVESHHHAGERQCGGGWRKRRGPHSARPRPRARIGRRSNHQSERGVAHPQRRHPPSVDALRRRPYSPGPPEVPTMSMPVAVRVFMAILLALAGTLAVGSQAPHGARRRMHRDSFPRESTRLTGRRTFPRIGPGAVGVPFRPGSAATSSSSTSAAAPGSRSSFATSGGPVTITGTQFGDGGIIIAASSFLRLTGTGTDLACGADFGPRAQR